MCRKHINSFDEIPTRVTIIKKLEEKKTKQNEDSKSTCYVYNVNAFLHNHRLILEEFYLRNAKKKKRKQSKYLSIFIH